MQRNRAKRRLREALGQIPIREDRDYVVIATAEVARVPFTDPDLTEYVRQLKRREFAQ